MRVIDHKFRMNEDVALRMPLRVLWHLLNAFISGNSCSVTPNERSNSIPIEERFALSSFSISPHTRSRGRSDKSIVRQRCAVCGSTSNSKRAANCAALKTRRLSSTNVSARDCSQDALFDIFLPAERSINSAVSGIIENCVDCEVASAAGVFKRHTRIAFDHKCAMTAT